MKKLSKEETSDLAIYEEKIHEITVRKCKVIANSHKELYEGTIPLEEFSKSFSSMSSHLLHILTVFKEQNIDTKIALTQHLYYPHVEKVVKEENPPSSLLTS
jgi:hypothetical protein